jgi:polysaccharide pyruvyl transferase WcaK-like protein
VTMWIDDTNWIPIPSILAKLSANHRCFLAPNEFSHLSGKTYPIGFGQAVAPEDLTGFAIPKDDVDRLPQWLLESAFSGFKCVYANDVFVVYSRLAEDQHQFQADAARVEQHLPYFLDKHRAFLQGGFFRSESLNRHYHASKDMCLDQGNLLINANGMGNFGEELLIEAVRRSLQSKEPDTPIIVARPDFNPPIHAAYKRIVIGGGGMLYDMTVSSTGTQLDLENVTNYFRYAFIAKKMNAQFMALGLGDQHRCVDYVSHEARWLMSQALDNADVVTTRDAGTAQRLQALTTTKIESSVDLSFYLRASMRHCAQIVSGTRKITIVGELPMKPVLCRALADLCRRHGSDVRYLAQANEDIDKYKILTSELSADELDLTDIRLANVEDGLKEIAKSSFIITSRFHTMVCAIVMGIPFLAVDRDHGKKARLLREISGLDQPPWLIDWSLSQEAYAEKFAQLISNKIEPIGQDKVDAYASRIDAIDQLW